jgi:hypothetical protein
MVTPKYIWSERKDSNLRPLAPHASALPGCATPRKTMSIAEPGKNFFKLSYSEKHIQTKSQSQKQRLIQPIFLG